MTKLMPGQEAVSPNHEIFMAVAKWCGHDSRGLEIPFDDIPLIQERYSKFKAGQPLEYDHLGFTVKQFEIVNSIYLPIYYNPEIRSQLDSLVEDYELISLGTLCEQGIVSVSTGDEVGKLAWQKDASLSH